MIAGQQTLASINQALVDEHGKFTRADRMLDETNDQLISLQQAQADDFKALARLKVSLLASGKIESRIDQAEQQVIKLLEARKRSKEELEAAIKALAKQRPSKEDERLQQAEKVEQCAKTVDLAEAETQQRLDQDPDYQAQRSRTEQVERTARHAEEKAKRSKQDLQEKGEPYRNDPLFMYLWKRRYGTPDYHANPLTRWLDGKVAGLAGYADARGNFSRLQEIPVWLQEHAEKVRQNADHEFEILRDMDKLAREKDGIPALIEVLEKEQNQLDDIDARIAELATSHQQLLQKKTAYTAGEDQEYRSAIKFLASEMARDDLQDIRREAVQTPNPEDDLIVSRLLDREADKSDLEQKQQELRRVIKQHQQRLNELQTVQTEFKRRRYDQPGSGFSDGALIAMTLADFLNGMLTREALWRVLEQQRRYRPYRSNPTFGSGGFGRGTVWGGGFRLPRGGGGFRLPGGFGGGGSSGGGGFRTGGGF